MRKTKKRRRAKKENGKLSLSFSLSLHLLLLLLTCRCLICDAICTWSRCSSSASTSSEASWACSEGNYFFWGGVEVGRSRLSQRRTRNAIEFSLALFNSFHSLSLFLNMSASALVSCTQRLQTCYLDLRTQVALAGRHVILLLVGRG